MTLPAMPRTVRATTDLIQWVSYLFYYKKTEKLTHWKNHFLTTQNEVKTMDKNMRQYWAIRFKKRKEKQEREQQQKR